MKYKLLKETPWIADGSIIEVDDSNIFIEGDRYEVYRGGRDYSSETYDWISWLIENHKEDFEEVKETPKPKWKVGDYAVDDESRFIKIFSVSKKSDMIMYNEVCVGGWFGIPEQDLRDPTQEELKIYFR